MRKLWSDLVAGDRIDTEYGPATVVLVYPESATGEYGAFRVMVQPDGYAASRTISSGRWPGAIETL